MPEPVDDTSPATGPVRPIEPARPGLASGHLPGAADILTVGFGTSIAMWGLGYCCRLPGTPVPSWLLFILLLVCLCAGGLVAGRYGHRGVRGGVLSGLLTGVLNLLIVGSLLGRGRSGQVALSAVGWVSGTLLVSLALGATGAMLGSASRRQRGQPHNWPALFALVTAGGTLLLLAVGGAVTGYDYGLAVVDWPNTEGYNMFLYPLARMTGGIYYEHSHRLIGSLVGLTTLALAVYLQVYATRRWLKFLAWFALAMVVTQGILGGLRVTGRLTLSTAPSATAPNIALAIVHGVLGQVFFGLLIALAVFQSGTWAARHQAVRAPAASTDRAFSIALGALLLLQLAFGALVRHLTWKLSHLPYGLSARPEELVQRGTWALHLHITVAVLVTLAALAVGIRLWGLYGRSAVFRRLGIALMILVSVQVLLGILALLVTGNDSPQHPPAALDVLITTGHQTIGAVLLALAGAIVSCNFRLLLPVEAGSAEHRPISAGRVP